MNEQIERGRRVVFVSRDALLGFIIGERFVAKQELPKDVRVVFVGVDVARNGISLLLTSAEWRGPPPNESAPELHCLITENTA